LWSIEVESNKPQSWIAGRIVFLLTKAFCTLDAKGFFILLAMTNEGKDARKWRKAKYYQDWAVRQGISKETINSSPDLVGLNDLDTKLFKAKTDKKLSEKR
jgi:hypothetical protein